MRKAQKSISRIFDASKYKIGIVVAKFNDNITNKILVSSLEKLEEYNVLSKNIDVRYVSGSVEIPVILQSMAMSKKYDCLLAIGAVIKGQTDHYHFVAEIVTKGILRVMLDHNLPIGFAVLTTPNLKLAEKRISIGAEAVEATLRNIAIIKKI